MIGQRLGRYEVLAKLGVGGMGVVYRAKTPSCSGRSRSSCCRTIPMPVPPQTIVFVEHWLDQVRARLEKK